MTREPVPEAPLVQTDAGLKPDGDGWFVVNLAEAAGEGQSPESQWWRFEGESRFPHFAINVHVFHPGEVSSMYHGEEGQERTLRQWDFFHCPPWTRHTFVGAGNGPCAVLMVGARNGGDGLVYPVDETAAKHGASVEQETSTGEEAYAGWPGASPMRGSWPPT